MPNRLAGSTSPYLLQHQDNPVDWRPWGDEAFAVARERDLPVCPCELLGARAAREGPRNPGLRPTAGEARWNPVVVSRRAGPRRGVPRSFGPGEQAREDGRAW
jgi:Protein of unknown function, DUF255